MVTARADGSHRLLISYPTVNLQFRWYSTVLIFNLYTVRKSFKSLAFDQGLEFSSERVELLTNASTIYITILPSSLWREAHWIVGNGNEHAGFNERKWNPRQQRRKSKCPSWKHFFVAEFVEKRQTDYSKSYVRESSKHDSNWISKNCPIPHLCITVGSPMHFRSEKYRC